MANILTIARILLVVACAFWTTPLTDAQQLAPADIEPNSQDLRCVESNYHHRTESELGHLTAEQLVDEESRHWNYHVSLTDRYGMFTIPLYTDPKRIGAAIVPVLAKVTREFASHPRSKCQEVRFFTALAMASDYDEQVVRLRSTEGGRVAISSALTALKAMVDAGLADDEKHPYNKAHFGLYLLESLRGINQEDQAIREVLASDYRVQLSDRDLAEFVDFLTTTYPTYPSWTPRVNMGRDLRPSKKKYYDAYLEFRKPAQAN